VHEQILERFPDAELAVYVVWLPVLPSDERFGVADVLVDERVRQFWDNDRLVSDEVGRLAGSSEGLAWDVYLVFGPDATWNRRLPAPLGTGAPVVVQIEALATLLRPYLA
jgi:hypothetical protein